MTGRRARPGSIVRCRKRRYPRIASTICPRHAGRVGAHRAENPRMRGWVVLLWAVLATIVLIAVGIFGTLIASGRVVLFPTPVADRPRRCRTSTAVVDTTYDGPRPQRDARGGPRHADEGRRSSPRAGRRTPCSPSEAGSTTSPRRRSTTRSPEDEAAARGLARGHRRRGGRAERRLPAGRRPEHRGCRREPAQQLVVVVGLDRTATPPSPSRHSLSPVRRSVSAGKHFACMRVNS